MLPLLTALAALATLTAVHTQTLRFSTSQSHHCVAAQPLGCTLRARYTCINRTGEDSKVTSEHAQHNPPQAARDLMM
jgi:hypothetical protein